MQEIPGMLPFRKMVPCTPGAWVAAGSSLEARACKFYLSLHVYAGCNVLFLSIIASFPMELCSNEKTHACCDSPFHFTCTLFQFPCRGAGLIEDEYFDSKGKNPRPYKTYELKKPFMGTQTDAKGYVYDVEKIRDTFMTPALVEWAGGPTQKRKVMNFSCGDIHLLVVTWDPASYQTQVFSSGNGAYGQLGHGNTKEIHELTPVEALNNKHISKVAAGNFHSLALTMNGRALYSWGKVDQGCLGLYDETKTLKHAQIDFVGTPQQVPFPTDLGNSFLVDIAAGTFCFVLFDSVCSSKFVCFVSNGRDHNTHFFHPASCFTHSIVAPSRGCYELCNHRHRSRVFLGIQRKFSNWTLQCSRYQGWESR